MLAMNRRGPVKRKLVPSLLALLALLQLLVLSACSRPIEEISDDELQRKFGECAAMNDPAPAMIFACENYERECRRRNEKSGRYIC